MSQDHTAGDGVTPLDVEYYQFCRAQRRPYFGRVMWASQGLPLRHVVMQELVRLEAAQQGADPFHILEVGSWAGGSAITWAEALTRHHGANGRVLCVDSWKPYFDMAKRPDAAVYREMSEALAKDTIYELFLHNISTAGYASLVLPLRGASTVMLPALPRDYFDLVFVDGDHSYAAVLADITAAAALIRDGGLLCGDDLERQCFEIDATYARTQIESDYIRDPRSGHEYHPGVTLAVGELFGEVSHVAGCWAVRRRGTGWERVDMSKVVCSVDRIPQHLAGSNPAADPDFDRWREERRRSAHLAVINEPNRPASSQSTPTGAVRSVSDVTPRALLIQLDFQTWATARPWTYSAGFGVQEGLTANGVECVTVPAIAENPCSSAASWVYHAKKALAGQRFDQVWLWLIHTPLDQATLDWVAGLAPVRVGVLMESLRYDEEDYAWAPQLKLRPTHLEAQLPYLTHVLAPDELDAADLNARGLANALWWPPMVSERFIITPSGPPTQAQAVFHGTPYGRRQNWVSSTFLQNRLCCAKAPQPPTRNQQLFDQLQQIAVQYLSEGHVVPDAAIREYAQSLQQVRLAEFTEWMAQLSQWPAIVNLPSLAKFYGGRVIEAMAAGRPVISWNIPSHPKNLGLFEPEKEILLFQQDGPGALAQQIDRVLHDQTLAESLARQAQGKIKRYHTAERRLQSTLDWIRTGRIPDYGLSAPDVPCTARNGTAAAPESQASQACAPLTTTGPAPRDKATMDQNEFYVNLFVNKPAWSTPEPNADEAARWSKIASFLEYVVRQTKRENPNRALRILDVGCGRGWLTNLATAYGTCEGIEPVVGVVEHARRMFPHLRFEAGTPEAVLARPGFTPFDIVLCSEVIEHVPHPQKAEFVGQLARLLTIDGYLILTTPRGDVWEEWRQIAPPNQPVEDWVTEQQLGQLLTDGGFQHLGLERIPIEVPSLRYFPAATAHDYRTLKLLPIYQVWACRRRATSTARPISFTRKPMVSVIVPTYNRPDRLRIALESITRQHYQDFEIIVVNDGTAPVEPVIAELNSDGRITLVNQDHNRGLAASRNTGLRLAKGTYVAYLDDDDRMLPDHLGTLVTFLERGTHQVAYTDAWRIIEQEVAGERREVGRDLPYSQGYDPTLLLVRNYIPVLCLMHRRTCLDEVGMFDESLFVHEDWDLWIRLATLYPFAHIAQTTAEFTWRTDGSSMTSHDHDAFCRTTDIIYRKYFPYVATHPNLLEQQRKHLHSLTSRVKKVPSFSCSIIIPVWNNAALTAQCLTALADVTDHVTYEVIVVDNGSTDGVQDFLRALGGDVQVIRNEENLGFAKACNQGAGAARGEYLVFLNNDTVPLKGWLSALTEEVRTHADVAVVGSKLLFEDGTIQHAGVAFSREGFLPYHMYRGAHAQLPCVSRRRELQCVTAACMLVRRHVFEQVGGFDEDYRNGFEDVDLCLKIREQKWKIVYQPQSVLYHLESKTPGRKDHDTANSRRLISRWGSSWWLADEDLLYFQDGYASSTYVSNAQIASRIDPIGDPTMQAQRALIADVQRAAQRRDKESVAALLQRVDEWPADPWILRWGALLCLPVGSPQLATSFWHRVLTLDNDPLAHLALAKHELKAGAVADADSHLTELLKLDPSHGEGWFLRGIVAMQHHAYAQAEAAFEQAKVSGADQHKASLGIVMAALGDNRAEAAWSQLMPLCANEPDDEECMHWLLRCGTALQRWDAVGARLSSFLARNPGNVPIRFAFAGVLFRAGRRADAQREYETLRVLAPMFEGMDELAKQLEQADVHLVPNHAA